MARLHWRWNDMRPTDELYEYFMMLKDRCASLSVCAKVDRVHIDTSIPCVPSEKKKKKKKTTEPPKRASSIMCPHTAFDTFLGRNQQVAVMKIASDVILTKKERVEKEKEVRGMEAFLKKRQMLNERIAREVRSLSMGFSSLHDPSTRPRSGSTHSEHTHDGQRALGDTLEKPTMVKKSLNLGTNMLDDSSTSSDDEEESDDGGSVPGKRQREEEEEFFESRTANDALIYSEFGKSVTDKELSEEVLCRWIMATVANQGVQDVPTFLKARFLPCLSTFVNVSRRGEMVDATMVTSTNRDFLVETHAMMCEMDEEIRAWNTLMVLEDGVWPVSNGGRWRNPEDPTSMFESNHTILPQTVDEKIAFERGKVESALSWAYDFCKGKRNQFISRNIRELFFIQYLLPGEAEIMLMVNHLKHSSIVPSVIVSRLRDDVERLDKLIYDFTLYNTIEEFARENGLSIHDGNKASIRLGKNIQEGPTMTKEPSDVPQEPSLIQSYHRAIDAFKDLSVRDMLQAHITLDEPPIDAFARSPIDAFARSPIDTFARSPIDAFARSPIDGDPDFALNSDTDPVIHPTAEYLGYLSRFAPPMTFLNPTVSVGWKSPRGIVQVVRIILLQCVEFFMKEIDSGLDSKRFFFTKRMTLSLVNDPEFIRAVDVRESPEESGDSGDSDEAPLDSDVYTLLHQDDPPEVYPSTVEPDVRMYARFRMFMDNRFEMHCQRLYHGFPITLYCMTSSFVFWPQECVARECLGADSLLGYYSWLDASVTYISEYLIPDLVAHFHLSVYDEQQIFRSIPMRCIRQCSDSVEKMKRLEKAYRSRYTRHTRSLYKDGGMHYVFLLKLIEKMPMFGGDGRYAHACSHTCSAVIKMSRLMYPDILERNFIHVPPASGRENDHDDEVPQSQHSSSTSGRATASTSGRVNTSTFVVSSIQFGISAHERR
jgi:hypothetical protein